MQAVRRRRRRRLRDARQPGARRLARTRQRAGRRAAHRARGAVRAVERSDRSDAGPVQRARARPSRPCAPDRGGFAARPTCRIVLPQETPHMSRLLMATALAALRWLPRRTRSSLRQARRRSRSPPRRIEAVDRSRSRVRGVHPDRQGRQDRGHASRRHAPEALPLRAGKPRQRDRLQAAPAREGARLLRKLPRGDRRVRARQAAGPAAWCRRRSSAR